MNTTLRFILLHPDVRIVRATPSSVVLAGHAVTAEGYPFSELSKPLSSLLEVRLWLGY